MKYTKAIKGTLLTELFILAFILAVPVQAQDENNAENQDRRAIREERRADFLEHNPQAAAKMEQRRTQMKAKRAEREEYLENHPEEAAKMAERRAEHRAEMRARRGEREANT